MLEHCQGQHGVGVDVGDMEPVRRQDGVEEEGHWRDQPRHDEAREDPCVAILQLVERCWVAHRSAVLIPDGGGSACQPHRLLVIKTRGEEGERGPQFPELLLFSGRLTPATAGLLGRDG